MNFEEEPRMLPQTVGLEGSGFPLKHTPMAHSLRPVSLTPARSVFEKFGSACSEAGDGLAGQEFPPLWPALRSERSSVLSSGSAGPAFRCPFFSPSPRPLEAFKMATLAFSAAHVWDAFSRGSGGFLFLSGVFGGTAHAAVEWDFPQGS